MLCEFCHLCTFLLSFLYFFECALILASDTKFTYALLLVSYELLPPDIGANSFVHKL